MAVQSQAIYLWIQRAKNWSPEARRRPSSSRERSRVAEQVVKSQVQQGEICEKMSNLGEEMIKKFDGQDRHEWPDFSKKLLGIGIIKGGWDVALTTILDMTDADNKKLNSLAWGYLIIMLDGEAMSELDNFPSENAYEAWQHLTTKSKDDKAYADLEMKFAECGLGSPEENPERWINKLIRINNRIAGCHTSQKKSDVMMIAHVYLSYQG